MKEGVRLGVELGGVTGKSKRGSRWWEVAMSYWSLGGCKVGPGANTYFSGRTFNPQLLVVDAISFWVAVIQPR
jgi:hypothetical protein